ncbi:TIGR01777 family oxidoreductase [Chloroflexi bacterium TSY]|nr:TIGR01777 family oxidoreductase [Chloroflexi bacterium TSY]
MRIIISGGTGLIGRALQPILYSEHHDVIILSRSPERVRRKMHSSAQIAQWDGQSTTGWGHLIDGADAVINLAGTGIADARWSDERKQAIQDSRVRAGEAIVQAIDAANTKPKVLIQASAVGYYGVLHGDSKVSEDSGPGNDFLAQICFDWEASTSAVETMGVRRATIRTGIVLSNDGGAWPKIKLPYSLFAGGPLGSGRQWYPWIHMEDEVRAIQFLLQTESATGPYNLTAPEPVTNKVVAKTIGESMGRPSFMPAPRLAIKLALGEMSTLLLDGQRAIPRNLLNEGFTFNYPSIDLAVQDLIHGQ